MTDVILVAVILVFFLASAWSVRALGSVIADSGDIDYGEDADGGAGPEDQVAGRRAGDAR